MKRYLLIIIAILAQAVLPAAAMDIFKKYGKVIVINQSKQTGVAYENGQKVLEFEVMTGDDENTTPPGAYVVKMKDDTYYSRKYDTWMPYSMFFDMKDRKAIHEGEVPPLEERKKYATHGCIHVESPEIEWLYAWAEENTTAVVILGWRDGD